jgi:hypothetical protein
LTLVSGRGTLPYPGPPLTTYDRQPGSWRQPMMAPALGAAPRTAGGLFGMPHVCWNGFNGWMDMLHAVTVVLGVAIASAAARAPVAISVVNPAVTKCRPRTNTNILPMQTYIRFLSIQRPFAVDIPADR